MKVWELIGILSKLPAGAEVVGVQRPHDCNAELETIDSSEATGDSGFVVLAFAEHADNQQPIESRK